MTLAHQNGIGAWIVAPYHSSRGRLGGFQVSWHEKRTTVSAMP
jgi:hypothetical protein